MKKLVLSILFVVICASSFAQEKGGIWGNVIDYEMDNEPLIFAQVELEGAAKSVQTNFHGNFEFTDIAPGEYNLVISYPGYESLKFPIVVESDHITRLRQGMSAKKIGTANYNQLNTTSADSGDQSTSGQE